ncbi:unnamed protein product, partial [Gadus morhua 'NCC']
PWFIREGVRGCHQGGEATPGCSFLSPRDMPGAGQARRHGGKFSGQHAYNSRTAPWTRCSFGHTRSQEAFLVVLGGDCTGGAHQRSLGPLVGIPGSHHWWGGPWFYPLMGGLWEPLVGTTALVPQGKLLLMSCDQEDINDWHQSLASAVGESPRSAWLSIGGQPSPSTPPSVTPTSPFLQSPARLIICAPGRRGLMTPP